MSQERGPEGPNPQPNRPERDFYEDLADEMLKSVGSVNPQTKRPELGLTVFQPQTVSREVQLYQETLDLDQKSLILNKDIVQVEDAVATQGTVNVLALLASEQNRGISQYRSDVVTGLNPENLVAVTNG